MKNLIRIAIVGPMGVGKSTALRAVCGDTFVECEAPNLDKNLNSKATTTVGAEFGEVDLGEGDTLQLYGSPGQPRFEIVRASLLSACSGVMLMTEATDVGFSEEMAFLTEISSALPRRPLIVVAARPVSTMCLSKLALEVSKHQGCVVPVINADPRDRTQIVQVLQILVSMLMVPEWKSC